MVSEPKPLSQGAATRRHIFCPAIRVQRAAFLLGQTSTPTEVTSAPLPPCVMASPAGPVRLSSAGVCQPLPLHTNGERYLLLVPEW